MKPEKITALAVCAIVLICAGIVGNLETTKGNHMDIKVQSTIKPEKNMADQTRFWIGSDHTNVQRLWIQQGWKSERMKHIEKMNDALDRADAEFLNPKNKQKTMLALVGKES